MSKANHDSQGNIQLPKTWLELILQGNIVIKINFWHPSKDPMTKWFPWKSKNLIVTGFQFGKWLPYLVTHIPNVNPKLSSSLRCDFLAPSALCCLFAFS